jgi:MFS family permease
MSNSGTGRYRDLLRRNRDFRVLTGAFLVDSIGGWACSIVLIVWVFDQTHSPTWVAATTAAGWLPRAVFSTYAGVLADRYERTQVMLVSAMLAFLSTAALTVVVAASGPVVLALACQAAGSIVYSGYRPAAQAVLPDVVAERELVSANALFGALENLVVVIGPGLGGLLLVVGSPAAGVAVNALSFLGAALLVVRLDVRSRGDAVTSVGVLPVVLAAMDVRRHLRSLLVHNGIELPVLSYQELAPEYNVQPLATVAAVQSGRPDRDYSQISSSTQAISEQTTAS